MVLTSGLHVHRHINAPACKYTYMHMNMCIYYTAPPLKKLKHKGVDVHKVTGVILGQRVLTLPRALDSHLATASVCPPAHPRKQTKLTEEQAYIIGRHIWESSLSEGFLLGRGIRCP